MENQPRLKNFKLNLFLTSNIAINRKLVSARQLHTGFLDMAHERYISFKHRLQDNQLDNFLTSFCFSC